MAWLHLLSWCLVALGFGIISEIDENDKMWLRYTGKVFIFLGGGGQLAIFIYLW